MVVVGAGVALVVVIFDELVLLVWVVVVGVVWAWAEMLPTNSSVAKKPEVRFMEVRWEG